MSSRHDILTEQDVKDMVNGFYDKVNKDPLLSPIFNGHAHVDWDHHLPKMYQFWNHIILGLPGYSGRPFPPHTVLPIDTVHFYQWLSLFEENVDALFEGPNAELAKDRARNIATMFQYRLGLLEDE